MSEPKLTTMLHQLIRLKFDESPQAVLTRMGPAWRAEAYLRLREAIDSGEAVTIESLWGSPTHPKVWRCIR